MFTNYECSKCHTKVYLGEIHHCEKVQNPLCSMTHIYIYSSYSPKSRFVKSYSALGYEEYRETLRERYDNITGKMISEWKRRD